MRGPRARGHNRSPAAESTGAGESTTALKLVDIVKHFGPVHANDGISFEVAHGEILGLLGENGAGKTTLMNIVYGLLQPDSGEIQVNGQRVKIRNPQQATELGIGMVHQHFMLVPDMTVAENIALVPRRAPGLTRLGVLEQELSELSDRFGLNVDPRAVIGDLSVGTRQRVEIMKLLHRGADLLILDEPTAALTPEEWRDMAVFLRAMADHGRAVVFITHKLDELFGLVDRCTVLRDGTVVGTVAIGKTDKPALAKMMVGREVALRAERPIVTPGPPVLSVEGLCVEEDGREFVHDLSFEVHAGEVLGVAGVAGNGQNELVDALIGLRAPSGGEIRFGGHVAKKLDPLEFTRLGGALIPEDRHEEGLALDLSVLENLILKEVDSPAYSRHGIVDFDMAGRRCAELIAQYDIRVPDASVRTRQLSGGNQQKVILARELSRSPKLLIAFQPTRGLDVGAMEFVYHQINEAKRAGGAILLISFELDEIFSIADRFAVMADGRFLRTLTAEEGDLETVGLLLGGESGDVVKRLDNGIGESASSDGVALGDER